MRNFSLIGLVVLIGLGISCTKEDEDTLKRPEISVPLSSDAGEPIDLGLSVKWADRDMPGHYAWGETASKSRFTEENYSYPHGRNYFNISGSDCDAARANWGGQWRLPTRDEVVELMDACTWELDSRGDRVIITGPSGNSISLQVVQSIYDYYGKCYWTGRLFDGAAGVCGMAFGVNFSGKGSTMPVGGSTGLLIRPVCE